MTHEELKKYLYENYGEVGVLEPECFDKAIAGVSEDGRLIYSYDLLVDVVCEDMDLSYEDSVEWVEVNTLRTIPYMGELSPVVLYKIDE